MPNTIYTGKRKTSIARIIVKPGTGMVKVNKKDANVYFSGIKSLLFAVNFPFAVTNNEGKYDITANICGGGQKGQAEALRHAISKALAVESEENKAELKKNGLLTRDPRIVERKKYGKRGARRSFQFSKR